MRIVPTASVDFFPLDQQLELNDAHWSQAFTQLTVRAESALMPFEQATTIRGSLPICRPP